VEGIIDSIRETAQQSGGRVRSYRISVGELAQFDLRLVRELLKELSKGTPLYGAKAEVKSERSRVKCLSCGSVWRFDDIIRPLSGDEKEVVHFLPELLSSYSRCPSCSKSYFEIEEGRSVRIAEVILDV
jgi:Zn finger protein HypA/HybF involved in hydrogenase expression